MDHVLLADAPSSERLAATLGDAQAVIIDSTGHFAYRSAPNIGIRISEVANALCRIGFARYCTPLPSQQRAL
jgi:pimeloyl-ACP methyl ester carboxylesterase